MKHTPCKRKTNRRTKASDSINSKSNSWVLFERDLFHFDAPAFEHNKRDIVFKHIFNSLCAASAVATVSVVAVIVVIVVQCYVAVEAVAWVKLVR